MARKKAIAKKKGASKKSTGGAAPKRTAADRPERAADNDAGGSHDEAKRLMPKPGQVIVRMYRQGLGDCFLLAFGSQSSDGPRYVLIDCGVHARQTQGPRRLQQVMQDLAASTGNRLHVVVATHEHADHLSGFVQKDNPFLRGTIEIDELWVGWTEKSDDRQADRLRRKLGCARRVIDKALKQTIEKAGTNPRMSELGERIAGFTDFEHTPGSAVNASNALARIEALAQTAEQKAVLKTLKGRLAPQPTMELGAAKKRRMKPSSNELALALLTLRAEQVTYCEPKRKAPLTVPGIPNLRVYVLGPPRDTDLLEQSRPTRIRGAVDEHGEPQYKEVYLSRHAAMRALQLAPVLGAAAELGESKDLPDDLRHPFKSEYRRPFRERNGRPVWVDRKALPPRTRKFIEQNYFGPPASKVGAKAEGDQSWRRIDGDWLGAFEQLALDLDGDTNNTSLVLAFELGKPGIGPVLLFPGDAQVGNWLSWRDQSYQAEDKKITADDLLRRTVLYKVGHHASHNATAKRDPRETTDSHELGVPFGLELMDGIIAMIPVDRAAADKKMPQPWKMPHLPLYQRLREKAQRRVLRSDLSLLPLDEKKDDADLKPGSSRWSGVPGMRNAKWRQSEEQFTDGTPGPLYYDVLFESFDE